MIAMNLRTFAQNLSRIWLTRICDRTKWPWHEDMLKLMYVLVSLSVAHSSVFIPVPEGISTEMRNFRARIGCRFSIGVRIACGSSVFLRQASTAYCN